jgi:hypothetical protein
MNILDAVIIITIASSVLIGFFSGARRVTTALAALYLSTLGSAITYDSVARSVRGGVEGFSVQSSEFTAFIMLFILFAVAFYWVISVSFRRVAPGHGRFAIADNVGGAALAVIVGLLTVATTLSITVILLGALSQTAGIDAVQQDNGILARQIRDSEIVPVVLKLQPPISAAFRPWFSGELPVVLQPPPG